MPELPLLVEGLTHRYGDVVALDAVDLRVPAGCLTTLVGRNGAGKSTLLSCVAGWTRASAGSIRVNGLAVADAERAIRRFVVLVPDTPRFWIDLTAWEHLQFVAGVHRLRNWRPAATAILSAFGLQQHADAYPLAYSRGMRHKLALAMALLVQPRLLLLDEPFAPLDAESAGQLWQALRARADDGTGVLFSCHQLPPDTDPDAWVVLDGGRVAASGTTGDLRRSLGVQTVTPEALLRSLGHPAADG
ncbi:MAG TPA: ABC transporter ATP-binding protein [Bacillota bacterium]|nr:ABC transporter ATP-binding protein [Bacillota bacterium]